MRKAQKRKQGEAKDEVLRLIDECNALIPEASKHTVTYSRYNRYDQAKLLLWPSADFLVMTLLIYLMWSGDTGSELERIFTSLLFGLANAVTCYIIFINRGGKYVPLSNRKAVRFLRGELANMQEVCRVADAERTRLAPWLEKFQKLETIIEKDLDGFYHLNEIVHGDGSCRFYATVRLGDENRCYQDYDIDESNYGELEAEVAGKWWARCHKSDFANVAVGKLRSELDRM